MSIAVIVTLKSNWNIHSDSVFTAALGIGERGYGFVNIANIIVFMQIDFEEALKENTVI